MAQYADESTIRMVESPNSGDERLLVRFYLRPMQDEALTTKEGRPIFVEREYIEIVVPGDKDNGVNRPVRDEDKVRFSKIYDHWKRTGTQAVVGMPLEAAPFLTRAQVEELRYFNVTTVEALATLADAHTNKFMGLQDLKQKAERFLAAAVGAAPVNKLAEEIEKFKNENATLKQMLKEQGDKIEALLKQKR